MLDAGMLRRTAPVLCAPHTDACLRNLNLLRRTQKRVSHAGRRSTSASAAQAEPAPQAVPTIKPSLFERVCGSLLFVFPAAEGLYRLNLLSVDYLSKRAYEILWSARLGQVAAAAASSNARQDSAVQQYEHLCTTASALHGRVQGLADDLNSFLQPISLQACADWLHTQLQVLLALPPLAPIATSLKNAHEGLLSWLPAHHVMSTASPLNGSSPDLGQAGQAPEGFPRMVQALWAWVRDVLLVPPSLHSLAALACFGLGLVAIAWSLDRCVKQQQGGSQQHLQQPVGMLTRLQKSAAEAFTVRRPELVLASALGAVLLRLAFAPLMPPCSGVQGGAEQLVHDLYVTSSTFLSIATFYVAAGCMHRVLSAPLPYRPSSPATSAPHGSPPSAPSSPAVTEQSQPQQQQQQQQARTASTSHKPTFIPNPTPTAYDALPHEASTHSWVTSTSRDNDEEGAASSSDSPSSRSSSFDTSGYSRTPWIRRDGSPSSSSGRAPPHEPPQPVLFSFLGVFGASAAAVPHIASRLPRAVSKTFQEGALREILQAVEAAAAFHAAFMTFYTFASLLLNTSSPPASLVNTVLVYLLYRGCVEGVLVEVRGLIT